MDDVTRHMQVDDRLNAHEPFFEHSWAKHLFDISRHAPKLNDVVFDLTLAFKGVSFTAALPLLAVNIAERYDEGFNEHRLSDPLVLQLANRIAGEIGQQAFFLNPLQKSQVAQLIRKLANEMSDNVRPDMVPFPKQELWDDFVKVEEGEAKNSPKNEFRLSLWSSRRICYSSLFFAYEDFIVRCLQTQCGDSTRIDYNGFNKKCRETFGDPLTEYCWLNQDVIDAKLIRHALVHAGGRETPKLQDRKHGISVVDGRLQIVQGDVVALYHLLKERVTKVVEWAAHEAAFKAPLES